MQQDASYRTCNPAIFSLTLTYFENVCKVATKHDRFCHLVYCHHCTLKICMFSVLDVECSQYDDPLEGLLCCLAIHLILRSTSSPLRWATLATNHWGYVCPPYLQMISFIRRKHTDRALEARYSGTLRCTPAIGTIFNLPTTTFSAIYDYRLVIFSGSKPAFQFEMACLESDILRWPFPFPPFSFCHGHVWTSDLNPLELPFMRR